MKILFLQLSDIHIERRSDGFAVNIEKLVQSLNSLGEVDECVIVISGDITKSGQINEFKIAGDMIGNLVNKLKEKRFPGKYINILTVPGNHDLDLTNNSRSFEDITRSFRKGIINELVNKDIKSLENFYGFANRNKCFVDDKIICKKSIRIGRQNINFTLINTAPFSLEGSDNHDMGIHYLSRDHVSNLVSSENAILNIAVMHHSCEWFGGDTKEELRDILSNNFSLVFEGHEHDGFVENRKLNNKNSIIYMQGNTLSGDKKHPRGFTAIVYDTDNKSIKGTSFIWNVDYYKGTQILDEILHPKGAYQFTNTREFKQYLKYDDNQRNINQYFVFPTLAYNITSQNEELENKLIDNSSQFLNAISENARTIISGDNRSGKSTLSKFIYQSILNGEERIVPLLLVSEDLRSKKINRIVEYAFRDQYEEQNNAYDKFLQLDKKNRILMIDDAGKIEKLVLDKVLATYEYMFNNIILFSEENIDLNIQKRVIETLTQEKVGEMRIRPFLYDKRKLLISRVYGTIGLGDVNDNTNQVITELNNMISSQVKYFKLDPEFIINFVMQYTEESKFNFSTGSNVFSMVYENSIKNRIINNTKIADVNGIFNIMEEIAYYMHFQKKSWITTEELLKIIQVYNNDFRQNVKIGTVLNSGQAARLIIEKESKIRLKDNNLLAYFVAQALNKKYHYENVDNKIEYILRNLCFGINSDIILFMALITNNPKIIGLIMECAAKHFEDMEELSFDNNNIPFLCQSNFNVKNTIPDKKEKMEKEKKVIEYEEESVSEVVELIDEYGYNEEDIFSIENQLIKSVKYLEVLSKILPAFCHNMKANQQDELVKALYNYPNRFIYQCLSQINDNYEQYINRIYEKISKIRKEKGIVELNIDAIEKMVEQMGITLVISLYELIASTATSKQTISALEAFEYKNNSNYSIMNLMMVENAGILSDFRNKAVKLYNESNIDLVKSMIKFTVRNYFLDHDVRLVGEGQSLLDNFFGSSEMFNTDKRSFKAEIAKNKLTN